MSKIKFAVGVVLYHPKRNELERILQLQSFFSHVYVYDNTNEETVNATFFEQYKEVVYFGNGENNGLAVAYNHMLKQAEGDDADFLCLLDQDSQWTQQQMSKLMEYIEKNDMQKIAIVASIISYWGNEEQMDNRTCQIAWAINSGSFLNIKCLRENRLSYDEKYFIDRLDRDFCKQIELKGLKIMQVKDGIMNQELGEMSQSGSIHSPIRNYYMFRNRFYYNQKYYRKWKAYALNILQTVKQVWGIIKSRQDVSRNFKMLQRAVYDYRHENMGKMSEV